MRKCSRSNSAKEALSLVLERGGGVERGCNLGCQACMVEPPVLRCISWEVESWVNGALDSVSGGDAVTAVLV